MGVLDGRKDTAEAWTRHGLQILYSDCQNSAQIDLGFCLYARRLGFVRGLCMRQTIPNDLIPCS